MTVRKEVNPVLLCCSRHRLTEHPKQFRTPCFFVLLYLNIKSWVNTSFICLFGPLPP